MDQDLRYQVLRALTRDSAFLKAVQSDIDPEVFTETEERIIATSAIDFYKLYEHSIGPMLQSTAEEAGRAAKIGIEGRKKLRSLINLLQGGKMELVSVKALEDRVRQLKKQNFYENAVNEIVTAYEGNKFSSELLSEIIEKANLQLNHNGYITSDYFESYEERKERRRLVKEEDEYPRLWIDPLDNQIKAIKKGQIAMFLAPAASGKGYALVHVTKAYASQGLNVLHITLEDPKSLVEDRLDAALSGVTINQLWEYPKTVRKAIEAKKKAIHGRIRIIDGTESGWTVSQIERAWEMERQKGFIADAIVVDYDDEIVCEKQYKGESARRFEFAEIYRRMRRAAARLNVIWWTAAQTGKQGEKKKIISGKDTAEDYSKVRKVFLGIGIGSDKDVPGLLYLNVFRHRLDKSNFHVTIMSDFPSGIFYDPIETAKFLKDQRKKEL